MWPKKKKKKCSVCIHYLNTTMPFTKKRFSMPVRSMFCCLRYECLMCFHSDLAIPGDLSVVVRFSHSIVWHIHQHGNGCMTCDPSLQVFKGCNSSLIKSVIHAAKLERTGRMLSSAHSNDFSGAVCASKQCQLLWLSPKTWTHKWHKCFDCLGVCTFP